MSQLPPNPVLKQFDVLLGEWTVESPQFPGAGGHATFRWLEGGAYLCWLSEAPEPAPNSTWIIGSDEPSESCTALYHDSRAVSRVYRMSLGEGVWRVWREAPGFCQRFIGTLDAEARTISGAWEKSKDGSSWEHDFDLVYKKVG